MILPNQEKNLIDTGTLRKDQVFLKDNGRTTIKSLKNVGKIFIKSFFLIHRIIKLSKHIQLGHDIWL